MAKDHRAAIRPGSPKTVSELRFRAQMAEMWLKHHAPLTLNADNRALLFWGFMEMLASLEEAVNGLKPANRGARRNKRKEKAA